MAMTKAEMESHSRAYDECVKHARAKIACGEYSLAIKSAVDSWQHIDGMMQFGKRYQEKSFESLEAFDIILKYAPLLFRFDVLDDMEATLKSQKRIDRNTDVEEKDQLQEARELMRDAHRFWNTLEKATKSGQSINASQLSKYNKLWVDIAKSWMKIGILTRTAIGDATTIQFATRMSEPIEAKCGRCGRIARKSKGELLDNTGCDFCNAANELVWLC